MSYTHLNNRLILKKILILFVFLGVLRTAAFSADLDIIRSQGVLRHLGVEYANFVVHENGKLSGLDVEMMQHFAKHLGVRYQWVKTTWSDAFGDLTGKLVKPSGQDVVVMGDVPIRGDILANGLTILPWRQKVVNFSVPTFPTGVWLMARADASIKPIRPSGGMDRDIKRTIALLKGRSVLAMEKTCLDPKLYNLDAAGAVIRLYTASQNLNDIAPAMMNGAAETTLLDIPEAMVALQKWPGEIKVIGPISSLQVMGVAVDRSSIELLAAYNAFFQKCWRDGTYLKLVRKYYPSVFLYLGDFFHTND